MGTTAAPAPVAPATATAAIVVELGSAPGSFRVVNKGAAARLGSTVTVEQERDGRWSKVPVTNLELRETCDAAPSPACVSLPAGAALRPVPWTGRYCSSQCPSSCRLDGDAPEGNYRFVIAACEGGETYASPSFHRPPR